MITFTVSGSSGSWMLSYVADDGMGDAVLGDERLIEIINKLVYEGRAKDE